MLICFVNGCEPFNKKTKETGSEVIIRESADAGTLNPVSFQDRAAVNVLNNIFQKLLALDFHTLEIIPVVAESRPQIELIPGGKRITYRIRPEARWDDGSPILAKDLEFSMKVVKAPGIIAPLFKFYFDFIKDIKFYEDPLKITFVCQGNYAGDEFFSGNFPILQEKIYDPKGLMRNFSIRQLSERNGALIAHPDIVAFARDFNSEKYQREKEYIQGSGAYELDEWLTGQKIVLKKKANWWGNPLSGHNLYFQANATRLIYQVITDQTAAITALKAGYLDVMNNIPAKDFIALSESPAMKESFHMYTPLQLEYNYIGLNTKIPKLSEKKIRQALAYLTDVPKIIEVVQYGLAQRVVGPIHPDDNAYHSDLPLYDFNPDKAKMLLENANWRDSNNNGILDRETDKGLVELEFDLLYVSGKEEHKNTALMFQENARKAGIKVNIISQEKALFINNLKNHRFDIYLSAWLMAPSSTDHKQIYHTDSYHTGSNFTGFGNEESDALIEAIRTEPDEQKRIVLNKRFQEILKDEVAYIYLYTTNERIAIHKRFTNAKASALRPGYWAAGFLNQGL